MHKVGVFALTALFAALPVMACAVPNAAMTPAERECCKKMARQCGDMGMAKSHPCCQSTATPADLHAAEDSFFTIASCQFDSVSHASRYVSGRRALLAGTMVVSGFVQP